MYYLLCSACQDETWLETYETIEEVKEALKDLEDVVVKIIKGREIPFDSLK